MNSFFKPYEGNRPFLFISYAHLQSEEVVSTIRILHDAGWRLWYDEGIPAGSDWPSNIAEHMQNCEAVLFFLSERALASPNCFSEIRTADRLGKPILVIELDEAEPTGEWKELLENRRTLPGTDSAEKRAEVLMKNAELDAELTVREARDHAERLKEENKILQKRYINFRDRYKKYLEEELDRFNTMDDDLFPMFDEGRLEELVNAPIGTRAAEAGEPAPAETQKRGTIVAGDLQDMTVVQDTKERKTLVMDPSAFDEQ